MEYLHAITHNRNEVTKGTIRRPYFEKHTLANQGLPACHHRRWELGSQSGFQHVLVPPTTEMQQAQCIFGKRSGCNIDLSTCAHCYLPNGVCEHRRRTPSITIRVRSKTKYNVDAGLNCCMTLTGAGTRDHQRFTVRACHRNAPYASTAAVSECAHRLFRKHLYLHTCASDETSRHSMSSCPLPVREYLAERLKCGVKSNHLPAVANNTRKGRHLTTHTLQTNRQCSLTRMSTPPAHLES